jgi:hypothetical protein
MVQIRNVAQSVSIRKSLPANAPKFLIIGVQKCGTTALHRYLSLHPQIKPAVQKEIHYFNCDNRFGKGLDYYHSFFPEIISGQITFEASASYLSSSLAVERIYEYNPEIKMIAIIRNPIDRAYSAWNMYRKRYEVNRNWFFEEWAPFCCNANRNIEKRDPARLSKFNDFISNELEVVDRHDGSTIEAQITPQGFYHANLYKYFSLFSENRILIIENSNLLKHTESVLRRVESFIGVSPHSWNASHLIPVFEGQYSKNIDKKTQKLLFNLYEKDSRKLFKVTGESFDWYPSAK